MKVKLKVDEFVRLSNDKGHILKFMTPYGEQLGCYIGDDEEYDKAVDFYSVGSVHVLDVMAYRTKTGGLGLTVVLPKDVSDVELF